ncbi:MAG TPA: PAS domain S-box protein, partial [Gemmatimonadaceae bacterium]
MTTPATRPLLSGSSVAGAGIGVAAFLAVYSLASWVIHGLSVDATPWLRQLPGLRVPMAGSTAVLLLVLSSVLAARLHWPASPRVRFLTAGGAAFVSLVAVLELARARWNVTLPWDPPLTMVQTTIGVSVIGRMAVTAALCFLLASVALVSGCRWLFAGRAAAWVSDAASLTGAFIASQSLLGFAAGTPLAMEQFAIPMSVPAALAFLALFAAVVIARRVEEAPEARPASPHNFDWRMASWLSGLAMVCVVVAFWYAHSRQGQVRRAVLEELKILADMRAREAVAWRNERIGDTHTLSAISGLPEAIARLSAGGSPSDKLIAHITGHRHSYGYDRIALYDAALRPVLVFPDDSVPEHGLSPETRQAVKTTKDVIVEDLHRGDDGMVHMDFIAPVLKGSQFAGVVQETINAGNDLSLLDPWPVTSRSVETELLRRDGDMIDLLSQVRDKGGSAMTQRVAAADQTRLAAILLRDGPAGLASGLDYRDVPVLGVASPVPGTPWVVIAKMDQAEAFAPVRKEASLLLFGMVMLTALVALLVLNRVNSIARLQLERLLHAEDVALTAKAALRGSEARFHALAESSIVGIYVFQDGKYTYVNPAMAELFGYTVAEVLNVAPGDMVQPQELQRVNYSLERRLHGDARTMHYELRGRRKDGSTIEVEVYG